MKRQSKKKNDRKSNKQTNKWINNNNNKKKINKWNKNKINPTNYTTNITTWFSFYRTRSLKKKSAGFAAPTLAIRSARNNSDDEEEVEEFSGI